MSLKANAEEVLSILAAGRYRSDQGLDVDIRELQRAAVSSTRLYRPAELDRLREVAAGSAVSAELPETFVVDGTTQAVAYELSQEPGGALALLNFASARNPGGGFLNGAKAQEEDVCRCSGLYPCLLTCMDYYEVNRQQDSLLYTDHAIFSRDVPFFKTRGTGEYLPVPFVVSVITAPAPNTGPYLRANPGQVQPLEATFQRRWENVLCIARDQGIRRLLLGAWGCGAFGGDPAMASATAKSAILRHGSGFDKIVFAVPNSGRQSQANFEAFQATFS